MALPRWIRSKRFIIPAIIVIVVAVVLIGNKNADTPGEVQGDQTAAVPVRTVAFQDALESTIEVSGTLLPQEYTQLRAQVNAQVQSLVPVGTLVRQGERVASLYDSTISQTHAQALSAVNSAQQNVNETLSLNVESIAQAELTVNAALAALNAAQSTFENTQLLNDQNFSATLDSAEVAYEGAYNTVEQVVRFWGDGGGLNEFVLRDTPNGNLTLLNDTTNDFDRLKGAYEGLSPNVEGDIASALLAAESALSVARDFNDNVFRTLSFSVAIPALNYPQSLIDAYTTQSTVFASQISTQNTSVKAAKNNVGSIDITTQSAYIAAKNQLDQAQIQYDNAQSILASAQRQADIRTLGAQSQLTSAQIQLANAQGQFTDLTLRAPFTGVVIAHRSNAGDQVSPGRDILEMGKTDAVEIKLSLDESRGGALAIGQSVTINETLQGVISELSPTASLTTGKIDFTVLAANGDGTLNPGDIARVSINQTVPVDRAIILPLSLVTIGQDETFVLVAQVESQEGMDDVYRVSKRTVTLGDSYDTQVVIASGLEEGDLVIEKNGTFLGEGDEVEVVMSF